MTPNPSVNPDAPVRVFLLASTCAGAGYLGSLGRMNPLRCVRAVCFDWGGTLMSEQGPQDIPMGLWSNVEVIPGAAECLQALSGRLPLAIATNATVSNRSMVELALSRVSFEHFFSHIFCYTDLGYRKNQPQFWQVVSETLNVPRENIAMVGDTYDQDAELPRQFGVQGVWFNQSGAARGGIAVPVVTSLLQFSAWVENAA